MKKFEPKISILVPNYNQEKFIRKCLDSLVNQTYKNIEIIVVNDGSTDSSLSIIKEFADKYPNIQIVDNERNLGLFDTRKVGLAKATGEYIMYVDGDDFLDLDACEKIVNFVKGKDFDITIFNCKMNLLMDDKFLENGIADFLKQSYPTGTILYGSDIMYQCFVKNKFSHNVWKQFLKADFVRKVFSVINYKNVTKCEDVLISFFTFYFAKSCIFFNEKIYNYTIGTGVSTTVHDFYNRMLFMMSEIDICKYVYDSFVSFNAPKEYIDVAYRRRFDVSHMLSHILFDIMVGEADIDSANKIFVYLKENLGITFILNIISEFYQGKFDLVTDRLFKIFQYNSSVHSINHIAVHLTKESSQEINDSLFQIVKEISKLNDIIVFVEQNDLDYFKSIFSQNVFALSPATSNGKYIDYSLREESLEKIMLEHKIDCYVDLSTHASSLLFDEIVVKSLNSYFVAYSSELLSKSLARSSEFAYSYIRSLMVADYFVSPFKCDCQFISEIGIPSSHICQPAIVSNKSLKTSNLSSNTVLWVCREDSVQSFPFDAIDIFSLVKVLIHGARLKLVILNSSEDEKKCLDNYIEKSNFSDYVEVINSMGDIEKHYCESSVFLMTSLYESSPTVLYSSSSYGLPCVTYDMSYLDFANNNSGIINRHFRDIPGCAHEIVAMLLDKELLHERSASIKKALEEYRSIDISKMWSNLFTELSTKGAPRTNDCDSMSYIERIFQHASMGFHISALYSSSLITKPSEEENNHQKVKKSFSERILPRGSKRRNLIKKIIRK